MLPEAYLQQRLDESTTPEICHALIRSCCGLSVVRRLNGRPTVGEQQIVVLAEVPLFQVTPMLDCMLVFSWSGNQWCLHNAAVRFRLNMFTSLAHKAAIACM